MAPPPLDGSTPPTKESDMQSHQQEAGGFNCSILATQFPIQHSGSSHLSLTFPGRVFGTFPQSRRLPAPKSLLGTTHGKLLGRKTASSSTCTARKTTSRSPCLSWSGSTEGRYWRGQGPTRNMDLSTFLTSRRKGISTSTPTPAGR